MLRIARLTRFDVVFLATVVGSAAACDGSSLPNTSTVDGGAPDHDAPPSTGISVTGHVVTSDASATPIPGRSVTLLDAADVPFHLTTDGAGAFHADGVVPPYDALIAAATQGNFPTAYLGMSTPRPQLASYAAPVETCTPLTATLDVPLTLPQCGSAACNYSVTITSANASVGGSSMATYDPSHPPAAVSPTATWCGPSTMVDVGVSVLVSDGTNAHYFYAQSLTTTLTAGATETLAVLTPSPVATAATLTTTSSALSSGWMASLSGALVYANQTGSVRLFSSSGPSDSVMVPNIPGATLSLAENGSNNQMTSTAVDAVAGLPLTTTTYPLTLPAAPVFTTMTTGSTLTGTSKITWTEAATQRLFEFTMWTQGDSLQEVTMVFLETSGGVVDLGRLTSMGVQLQTQSVGMLLSDVGGAPSLDAVVDDQTLTKIDGTQQSSVDTASYLQL